MEPGPPVPAGLGQFHGEAARGGRVGRGDDGGEAVEGRVGKGEAAHDGDVEDHAVIGRLAHAGLAEVDQFAVGAMMRVEPGQHRHGGGHDGEADFGDMGFGAGEEAGEEMGGLGAAGAHVHMRVGAGAPVTEHGDILAIQIKIFVNQ